MKIAHFISMFFIMLSVGIGGARADSRPSETGQPPTDDPAVEHEFVFVRAMYTNYPGHDGSGHGHGYSGTWRQWWETDFSDADRNLLRGLQRYTTMDASSEGFKAMPLTDPTLFEYPFLYINMKRIPLYSGNGPDFKPQEAAVLREYMMRGGFVMLDDFWGPEHWQDFLVELAKIFPDRQPEKLPIDHPIFHSFFDISEIKQVPGRGVTWGLGMGFVLDNADYPTAVHGVFDDHGRLMMTVNFNTDLGDGWEHTFDEFYPTRYCNAAYKIGINTIIYALSH